MVQTADSGGGGAYAGSNKKRKKSAPSPYNYGRGLVGPGGNTSMDPRANPRPTPKPTKSSTSAIDFLKNSLIGRSAPKPTNSNPLSRSVGKVVPKAAPKKSTTVARRTVPVAPIVAGSSASKAPSKVTGGGFNPPKAPTGSGNTKGTATAINTLQSFIDKAKASVTVEDLPKLNALQRQLDVLTRNGEQDIKSTRNSTEAQKLAVQHLFGQLGEFQSGLKTAQESNYQALQGQTNNNYDQLVQQLTGGYDKARQSTTGELERLGLGSQVPVATAGQAQDQNFLTGLAATDKQHYGTQMAQSGSDFSQLMDMMRNNTQRESVSKQTQAGTAGELAIQEIMKELREGKFEIEGQRGDILATQGQRTRELAEGLEDKDYARRTSDEERQLARQIALEKLGMDKAQFAAQMQSASAGPSLNDQLDVALKQARLDQMLNPISKNGGVKQPKRTPEQEAKYILHRDLEEKGNPKSAANMTDLWNIIETLRTQRYTDHRDANKDGLPDPGKFSINDPVMLDHLNYALQNRFQGQAPRLTQTAYEIIRALTGNK